MKRLSLTSRPRLALIALVLIAAVVAVGYRAFGPDEDTRSYCALMPD